MWQPVSVAGALGSIEDVADLLGVSLPMAEQLVSKAGFPKPVGDFRGSTLWRLADVERWARRVAHDAPKELDT
jgi:predicted DNA-binding transcriptional regulator AlpA